MLIQPDPFGGVEEALAGERPALEIELFELVAIAFEHDVALLADALDLAAGGLELEEAEIVQAAERDHQVEMLIAPRVAILRAITEEMLADRLGRVGQAVA